MKMLLTGGFLIASFFICYAQNPPSTKENNYSSTNQNVQPSGAEKEKVFRNLTVGAATILLAFTALMVGIYRLKKKKDRQLNRILVEKIGLQEQNNILAGTFHNQTKNNLQLIINLLNLQSVQLENGASAIASRESKGRLTALEIIQEIASQSTSANSINMRAYTSEMIAQLLDNFATGNRIQCSTDVMAAINLNITQAVTVGLIIHEAVTNSIKYAFPNDRKGTVIVSFIEGDGDELLLSVADDGVGFPADVNVSELASGGICLMEMLSNQLEGNLRFRRDKGLEILLVFRKREILAVCHQSFNQN